MKKNFLPILVVDETNPQIKGLSDSQLAHLAKKNSMKVVNASTEIIEHNLKHVINESLSLLNSVNSGESNYEVDELEINLSIGTNGEVSILSTISGSANVASSMKLVIKRKN